MEHTQITITIEDVLLHVQFNEIIAEPEVNIHHDIELASISPMSAITDITPLLLRAEKYPIIDEIKKAILEKIKE